MKISKLVGTLVFVKVDTPKACFDTDKGQEWKASIVVTEDDADNWNDAYPKQKAKEIKTSEFEGVYKVEAPFPDQRKQYIVTLRKNTKLGNGNPVPPQYTPKVFQQKGNTLVEITTSVLVANGSEGQISIDHYEGPMGPVARLKNVKVDTLIEYVRQEVNYEPGSEFDDDDADDGEGNNVKVPAKAKQAAAKPVTKKKEESKDEFDDSPF